ncbi:uncharacterized protein LOC116247503 [Nymphaea colorata]|uniref:uncharacterized protein LOC116247503 n=1 Tax=Nymphaea colorata TaxID=210225 RepID=UPI00129DC525|nr:uncharacterized protein LOC116247503 [Nymphaea colorata]
MGVTWTSKFSLLEALPASKATSLLGAISSAITRSQVRRNTRQQQDDIAAAETRAPHGNQGGGERCDGAGSSDGGKERHPRQRKLQKATGGGAGSFDSGCAETGGGGGAGSSDSACAETGGAGNPNGGRKNSKGGSGTGTTTETRDANERSHQPGSDTM